MILYNKELLLLLIPLLVILVWLFYRNRVKKQGLLWSYLKPVLNLTPSFRVYTNFIPFLLQLMAVILVIVALARPQVRHQKILKSATGIDIMVLFDISFSMKVNDMNPGTRFNSAKNVLLQFINNLKTDRVGLVLFSGEAYTQIPLTLDYTLIKKSISKLDTSSDIRQGTAIGVAMATALARLRHSSAKSKIVIMITDGDNNIGDVSPQTAIHIAQRYGVKIYSIGVGQEGRSRIPIKVKDLLGQESVSYIYIDSKINKKLLSNIAKETGGQFYLAQNQDTLFKIFKEIDQLEKSKVEAPQFTKIDEKFDKYLKPAFFLYLISILLSGTIFSRLF